MRTLATAATTLALAVLGSSAHALSVRTSDAGGPIAWRAPTVPLSIDPTAEAQLPGFASALGAATEAWADVPTTPRLFVAGEASMAWGYTRGARNENTVHAVASNFPFDGHALAITVVTTQTDSGEVLDTDVLVDVSHNHFELLGPAGLLGLANAPFDLQNTLTHEMGHVLGLGEDDDTPAATMFPRAAPGEVTKRDLDAIDRESARLAYANVVEGPGAVSAGCGGPARVSPGRGAGGTALAAAWVGVALLALVAWRARARVGRGAAVFACALVVAGAFSPAAQAVAPRSSRARTARVLAAASRWHGGVIWTRATVRDAHDVEHTVERPGGRVGDVEQRVFDTQSGDELSVGRDVELTD